MVLSLGGGGASFFFGALSAPVDEGCGGLFYLSVAEHGEGEGYALAEAVVVDVVDVTVEGVDFVVEGVGIGASDYTPVLELAFANFYSGADELTFSLVSYFQLDEGGFLGCGLAFSVEEHTYLDCLHIGIRFLVSFFGF